MIDKGTLLTVKGDATKPQRQFDGEIVVIPHVCNNLGGWGAGFVLALNGISPEPKRVYQDFLKPFLDTRNSLGEVSIAKIDPFTYVANMIAQDGVVGRDNPKPIKYWALVKCMQAVLYTASSMIDCEPGRPFAIHCPMFGSALAGGNWDFILELIEELWLDRGFNVTVYEYDG